MEPIKTELSVTDLLGLWSHRKDHTFTPTSLSKNSERHQQSSEDSKLTQERKKFSDSDIDILLKKSHVQINEKNRLTARFLLRHHIVLDKNLFDLISRLMPNAPSGIEGEAFIAAFSKLPIDKVEKGYQIILASLQQGHPSIMEPMKMLIHAITDLISESYHFHFKGIDQAMFRSAFEEMLHDWTNLFKEISSQVKWIASRKVLLQKLIPTLKLTHQLQQILSIISDQSNESLSSQLSKITQLSRQTIYVLMTDSILSKEDAHHHLKENGYSYSAGTYLNSHFLPARLWIHDRNNASLRDLDADNLVLFFRWFTEELGILESDVVIDKENISITFASPHTSVLQELEEQKLKLEARINSLGYKCTQKPSFSTLKQNNQNIEFENHCSPPLSHLDAKA